VVGEVGDHQGSQGDRVLGGCLTLATSCLSTPASLCGSPSRRNYGPERFNVAVAGVLRLAAW
jgi:hypothetical protein